ncbi:unnamed protein product, partial [Mesorhabditis belari]|uniref:Nucleoporin NUP35 n=1 Tax=Mesorhabditis belari TaxID=2138241 RepID=A0AAF3FBX7_9BILA
MLGNTSPMQIETGSPRGNSYPRDPMRREDNAMKTPTFLFGNKRRSTLLSSNSYGPTADSYGSPLPSHLKDGYGSGGKSVHWSPALVQEKRIEDGFSVPHKPTSSAFPISAHKGPPLRSLRDNVEPTNKVRRMTMPVNPSHVFGQSTPTTASRSETTPFDNDRAGAEGRDCWVTVFGFSPNEASNIISFFGRHGEIIQQQFPTHGNWVHLRYSSPVHAAQAVSRNGTLFDAQTRIGVMPCKDEDVLNCATLNRTVNGSLQDTTNTYPAEPSRKLDISYVPAVTPTNRLDQSVLDSSLNISRTSSIRNGMRPLAASLSLPPGDTSMNQSLNQSKDHSFFGRFWNLVG